MTGNSILAPNLSQGNAGTDWGQMKTSGIWELANVRNTHSSASKWRGGVRIVWDVLNRKKLKLLETARYCYGALLGARGAGKHPQMALV